ISTSCSLRLPHLAVLMQCGFCWNLEQNPTISLVAALRLSMNVCRRASGVRIVEGAFPLIGMPLLPRHRNIPSPKRWTRLDSYWSGARFGDQTTLVIWPVFDEVYMSANQT